MERMKKWIVLGLFATAPLAQAAQVYVQSNQPDHNTLLSFDLSTAGFLTEKAPIETSGTGVVDSSFELGPFDSDQEIITNPAHSLLFSVNSGSNSIAVFQIQKDGSLKPVPGSPFDSHGINPVSLGLTGSLLTVVNKHGDPAQANDGSLPNYTNFWVNPNGQLRWISASTVEVASGSSPSQALNSPLGPYVFGADFLGGLMQSFEILKQGTFVRRTSSGVPAAAYGTLKAPHLPLGLAAHPKQPYLYVGLPTANKIAVYTYDNLGQLHFQTAIADSGAVVCWLRVNSEGTRLYASNTADPSVTVYDIATNPALPKELQKLVLPSNGGAYQLALTPDESQLVVLTQRYQASTPVGQGNELHVLTLDKKTGIVSGAAKSPLVLNLPGDTRPQGIVIF